MKLGEGVEATIHCATLLAQLEPERTLPASALAEYHGLSPSYLLKHLKQLTAAGLLESVSGPHGGYRLARSPNRITLLDVVVAIEGRAPAFRCAEIRQRGPGALEPSAYVKPCGINAAMLRAERAYRDELRRTTLADVIEGYRADADPRAIAFGCAFVARNQRPRA
ncbi:Rrf2 family transcriptional regulator [Nitratireductor sp. ZSWI3]|uniref:RrF2 family transcriptional regulator n=1 Tax=Nitratireductor sp. ZSWI3 TaxID=2966359 RepID=UPI0021502DDD|nr:Rrf2 family transcriptional regulator [Nitratireductor sp. ZSWI3]MCR4268208.1 Rrf2 family transcriptional regulator [Nitratireductor sp. ZSWI3]